MITITVEEYEEIDRRTLLMLERIEKEAQETAKEIENIIKEERIK